MEVYIAEQTKAFFLIAVLGVALGFLYDIMHFVRLLFRQGKIITCVLDLLFCVVCTIMFFAFTLTFMRGQVRGFGIVGCALGGTLYFLGISPYIMKLITPFACAISGVPQKICKFLKKLASLRPKK